MIIIIIIVIILFTIMSINAIKRNCSTCKYVEIFTYRHVGTIGALNRMSV
jgi:hypothetical protein